MIDTNTFCFTKHNVDTLHSMSDLWNGRLIQPRSYFFVDCQGQRLHPNTIILYNMDLIRYVIENNEFLI